MSMSLARTRPNSNAWACNIYRYESITIAPPSAAFSRVFQAVCESWQKRGGDPNIGCRLPGLLHHAGFDIRELNPLVRLARPGSTNVRRSG